jgi:FAD/FMN-containing dehydrogenase
MFSEIVAKHNDYLVRALYEKEGKTTLARLTDQLLGCQVRQTAQATLARTISVTVFPLFAVIDACVNLIEAAKTRLYSHLAKTSIDKKKYRLQSDQFIQTERKCLRGFLAALAGLISPDLVTHHFLPENRSEGVIAAGGKYHFAPGHEVYPTSLTQVQALVRKADRENKKISIAGAHMSQSKDTLPVTSHSISLNMQRLNAVKINVEKQTAIVQAGATWKDVQAAANPHGLAIKVMQASNVFSIGGSLGVNCHGWDHRTGTLAETVRSLTIVDAMGKVQVLTPQDERFGLVIGGHGFFGVIIEAELELAQNDALVTWGEKVAPKDYAQYFQEKILPNDNHVMHLYRLSLDPDHLLKEGVAVSYSRKTKQFKMPGLGVSATLIDEPLKGTRTDRILVHMARCLKFVRKSYWTQESQKILKDERILRNAHMRPPIRGAFSESRADAEWLQEYFVKAKDLAPFLDKLSQTLMDNKVSLFNASVRYVKQDNISALPYAKGEDHFAVVLFFNQSLAADEIEKTKAWVQEIINYLIECGGTYYLPYQHFATPEQFCQSYPGVEHVMEMKDKYDTRRLFDNGLYADYFHPLDAQRVKSEEWTVIRNKKHKRTH